MSSTCEYEFGVYDGSYIIINIPQNYPIKLNNQDISNLISIETFTNNNLVYHPNYKKGKLTNIFMEIFYSLLVVILEKLL